jgi:hypothetical protein
MLKKAKNPLQLYLNDDKVLIAFIIDVVFMNKGCFLKKIDWWMITPFIAGLVILSGCIKYFLKKTKNDLTRWMEM